jgi:capsular exopolysaccharide synthesis family protein
VPAAAAVGVLTDVDEIAVAPAAEPQSKGSRFDEGEMVNLPRATRPAPAAVAVEEEPALETRPEEFTFNPEVGDKMVIGRNTDPAIVEQYRRLGAVLHHAQQQDGARSVMISSAVAAEGKTLTSINLALTMSQSYERRVLLIDADLRRPNVHELLRLPNRSGLAEILRRPDDRLRVAQVMPSLWVLTAGHPDPDPMRALVSDAMRQLLFDATQQFDWVIVDTPPVALLPDANLLAVNIDTALLVVGANTTPYPLVRKACEAIGASRVLGVVLNRAVGSAFSEGYTPYTYREEREADSRPARPWRRVFRRK